MVNRGKDRAMGRGEVLEIKQSLEITVTILSSAGDTCSR